MSDNLPEAVVLAGGKGTRLAPYTTVFPKPLVPLGDLPILEIVLRQLRWYGVRKVHISVGHLGPLIEAYFMTRGAISGLEIAYLRESMPLGTAGAVSLLDKIEDDILVVNGDIVTTLDYTKIVEYHRQRRAAMTIGVHTKKVKVDLGVLELDEHGTVLHYTEKPVTEHQCSMGVYVYSAETARSVPQGKPLDFPDLVLKLLDKGEYVAAFQSDCYWLDIGRPEDYERAALEFAEKRHLLLPDEQTSPKDREGRLG